MGWYAYLHVDANHIVELTLLQTLLVIYELRAMSATPAENKLLQGSHERLCNLELEVQDGLPSIHDHEVLVDNVSCVGLML